ncbi:MULTISPECIES: TetR/AcrR family transcriptional regulator [Rhodococcus]|uniref:TetR family transcriptional regulator n=2 Tax=Rhodococcus TaxID=1827 RepID=M2WS45_9NOCA|nr:MULTISPECIES: TetR family transcriptional regulator [Rhodococcus]EME51556.1 TetR family transcriptional regulator [Rhodococcus ruber BKS 20-38]KOS54470.1 TetR family transcriptional regulator [Rhodococcus rhodochrous KG-21]
MSIVHESATAGEPPRAGEPGDRQRVPFHEASRMLLRNSVLDAMRDLLTARDWSAVTMTDVARGAGVSRQTLYNEFSSRQGLAQAYALRLVDQFVDAVDDAIYTHVGQARAALVEGFTSFFVESSADPLIQSLLRGDAKPDLLRLITTDSAPLIERASARLSETFQRSWVQASAADAGILGRAIVRVAMSYISMPPESDRDVAADLAELLGPFIDRSARRD